MITLNDVKSAAEKVSSYVHRTPLWKSETLSRRLGTNVYLKMELFQKTGSFKPRGAFNQILARGCLLYTSPSPRDGLLSRMPSSA